MAKPKSKQVTKQFKSRKETRKDKRTQKKANRVHFQKRKKELKLEYKERLKQQKSGGQKNKKSQKNQQEKNQQDEQNEQADDSDINDAGEIDDEEIDSDVEFSDDELQMKLDSMSKKTSSVEPIKPTNQLEVAHSKLLKQEESLRKDMRKRNVKQLKLANKDEDKTIKKLEKMLGLNKTKHKGKKRVPKMFNDGLDYALELCEADNLDEMYAFAKQTGGGKVSDSEWTEDFALATGELDEADLSDVDSEMLASDLDEADENVSMADSDDEAPVELSAGSRSRKRPQLVDRKQPSVINDAESEEDSDDESESEVEDEIGAEDEQDSDDEENNDSALDDDDAESNSESEAANSKPDVWEDIYGRKRDKDGNIITESNAGKYIPPHLRAKAEAANNNDIDEIDPDRREKLQRLKRILKGLLNRLSEANMHKIATEIENMYMANPRHDMNSALSALIFDALITHALAADRMVLEHALLIAALHANVGSEVGANMLEKLVDRFHLILGNGIEHDDVGDKTLDNVVFFLCHMYTFKMFHHKLVYEILNRLIETFCEKSVECVLLTLRSVGFTLRKDDPAALKEFIIAVQKKTSETSAELKSNTRLKYMLDVLQAIKSNNVNRIPSYDPTLSEHLRKVLKSLCSNGKYVTALNISLNDLASVQNRGKWWVIGSAWSGNISDISGSMKPTAHKKHQETYSSELLELAKKQRMNTDERRNIFCVLMSAEDYIDAFEKLSHLAIKDQRIIVAVIIHCCLCENKFNPYYAAVARKFCDYDRKYQLAFQFSIWDRIKDIESLTKQQSTRFAQFIINLITHAALPISVLKIVKFSDLEERLLRLVRQIMLGILLSKEDIFKEVFQRVVASAKLKAFKESLRLFIHHFMLKDGANIKSVGEDKLKLLKERIKATDKFLDTSLLSF